jgi:hypothetical protein
MATTKDILSFALDRAQEREKAKSDSELARKLKMRQATISDIRRGKVSKMADFVVQLVWDACPDHSLLIETTEPTP